MTVNKVTLIGFVGQDPEIRYTNIEKIPVCNISMATNQTWKDSNGNQHIKTEWHRIVLRKELAKICEQSIKKGSQIYIEGQIQSREYNANETKHKVYEIVASELRLLDRKKQ